MRRTLELELRSNGWEFERVTKGTHELWRHKEDNRTIVIPMATKDVGRKLKNYLAQIRSKTRVKPPEQQQQTEPDNQEYRKECEKVGNPFDGIKLEDFRTQGGLFLGRMRKTAKMPTHVLAPFIGPDWNGKRLKDLEAISKIPIAMTPDEFLGWLIGMAGSRVTIDEKIEGLLQGILEEVMRFDPKVLSEPKSQKDTDTDIISSAALRKLRLRCGLSQEQAAKMLKCGRSTYAHFEAGRPVQPWLQERIQVLELYAITKEAAMAANESATLTPVPQPAQQSKGEPMKPSIQAALAAGATPQAAPQPSQAAPRPPAFPPSNALNQAAALASSRLEEPLPPPPPPAHTTATATATATAQHDRKADVERVTKCLMSRRITDQESMELAEKFQKLFMDLLLSE